MDLIAIVCSIHIFNVR